MRLVNSNSSMPAAKEAEKLVLRVVSEIAEFSGMKAEWDALIDDCPDADFFSSWAWTFSWWVSSGSGRDLRIYVVRSQKGELKAVLPCCLTQKRVFRYLSYYQLGFIGSTGKSGVYYQDLIARPRDRARSTNVIIPHLLGETSVWDMLNFGNMPAESPLTRRLPQEMPGHRFIGERRATAMLELPPKWNLYLEVLDATERTKLERAREKFAFLGNVQYRMDVADRDGVLMKKFHQSLPVVGKRAEQIMATQTQLLTEQDGDFQLVFHALENESGDWIAALACILWRSTCYCIDYRHKANSRDLDPFRLLVSKSIEYAINQNFSRCDLLGGDLVAAKLALTHQARDTITIGAYRDSRLGRLLRMKQRFTTGWWRRKNSAPV